MGCKIGICSSSLTASLCVDLSLRPVKAFSMRRKGNVHDPRWRLTPMSKASTGYSQRGDATPREAEKWLLDGDATHTRADLLKEQGRRYEREVSL